MSQKQYISQILAKFEYTPTESQKEVLRKLVHFVLQEKGKSTFILKGYAGTGKTSLLAALVAASSNTKLKFVLLAPTGRAAKVLSQYAKTSTSTIHRHIYFAKSEPSGVKFALQPNRLKDTVFVVDEASMIGDDGFESHFYEKNSLLSDLHKYIENGTNCKLVFVGDSAQLPPVKSDLSPALDPSYLELKYNNAVILVEMKEVVRQSKESGVLYNATLIRANLSQHVFNQITFKLAGFSDIIRLENSWEIQDTLEDVYSKDGESEVVILVRSNKRANLYNQQIRSQILSRNGELEVGDLLMVVKNNYFWLKDHPKSAFVANGDIIEILEIYEFIDLYEFRFARVKINMIDFEDIKPFETILLLDTLASNQASLSYEDSNKLYQEVQKDYQDLKSKYKKYMGVKNNHYFNALQVKFAYALTCHKSQGGQWEHVLLEQPYLPNGIDKDYLRWLYTAVTRTRNKLYLMGFKDSFFEES